MIKKILDKNTILTTIYTIVDDALKGETIMKLLQRPGPHPDMTDAEVITVAVYQELIGEPRENHFYRLYEKELKPYFPNLIDRSRYNRRKRDLWSIILAVRVSVLLMLKAYELETVVTDSTPIPAIAYKRDKRATDFTSAGYGVCSSKAMKYFGYKFHEFVSLTGIIVEFMLSSASPHDSRATEELITGHEDILRLIIGDKAYNTPEVQQFLKEQIEVILHAPLKENQTQSKSQKSAAKFLSTFRLIAETVNAQLQFKCQSVCLKTKNFVF